MTTPVPASEAHNAEPSEPGAAPIRHGLVPRLSAEAVGSFFLVVAGLGVPLFTIPQSSPLPAALAAGLAVTAVMLAFGYVSGGHFNPAVTLGPCRGRPDPARRCRRLPRRTAGRGAPGRAGSVCASCAPSPASRTPGRRSIPSRQDSASTPSSRRRWQPFFCWKSRRSHPGLRVPGYHRPSQPEQGCSAFCRWPHRGRPAPAGPVRGQRTVQPGAGNCFSHLQLQRGPLSSCGFSGLHRWSARQSPAWSSVASLTPPLPLPHPQGPARRPGLTKKWTTTGWRPTMTSAAPRTLLMRRRLRTPAAPPPVPCVVQPGRQL